MKKILFLILILAQGAIMANTLFYQEINGVKIPVIFEEDKTLPTVYLKLVFAGGGSMEDGKKSGLSKLSYKLLNEGTKKLGTTNFAKLLDEKAIKLTAYSGFETAGVEFSCLKEYMKDATELSATLLKDPNYTEDTLKKIKLITGSQIVKREDDFDHVADSALKAEIFKGTALEHDAIGTKKSVESITLEDIKKFLKGAMTLNNTTVVIGGDLSKKEAEEAIAKLLSHLEKGDKAAKAVYFGAKSSKKEIKIKKETQQSYVYFGSPLNLMAEDKDAYKSRLASFILGSSGFGSRLMEIIRVKNGLAYSAYSRNILSKTHSYFAGHLQTKPENEEKAKELVKQIVQEFVKNGATQKELDGAKNFILGSEPLRAETLSQRLSRSFNEFYLGQPLGFYKDELESIKNVSLEDLNIFIKAHPEIAELTFSIVKK